MFPFLNPIQLPYLIDGDIKLTQTRCIIQYLGRKYNLAGANEQEWIAISLIDSQVGDLFGGFSRVCYDPNFCDKSKADYIKGLPDQLKAVSAYMGNKPFVAGMFYINWSHLVILQLCSCHLVIFYNL